MCAHIGIDRAAFQHHGLAGVQWLLHAGNMVGLRVRCVKKCGILGNSEFW
jgi:hypothetical protein